MPHPEPLGPLYSQPHPAGLQRLMDHLLALFPGTSNGGMFNPLSNLDSGAPSPHRVTQALDLMCPGDTAPLVIRYLVSIAEPLNLQQVIAWHEIWTVQRQSEGIRHYAPGDHADGNGHAHVHVGLAASRNFDVAWLGHPIPPPVPPSPPPPPTAALNFEDDAMRQARSILYPDAHQVNTFAIDGQDRQLRQVWIDGQGHTHTKNLSHDLGLGQVDPESPPTFAITPDGDLIVYVYGIDGHANALRYDKAGGGWSQGVLNFT